MTDAERIIEIVQDKDHCNSDLDILDAVQKILDERDAEKDSRISDLHKSQADLAVERDRAEKEVERLRTELRIACQPLGDGE